MRDLTEEGATEFLKNISEASESKSISKSVLEIARNLEGHRNQPMSYQEALNKIKSDEKTEAEEQALFKEMRDYYKR